MKPVIAAIAAATAVLLLGPPPARALNPSLQISQYGHTAWTVRDGFSLGTVFAMAQTPDGYLWLGSGFGLFRFDGVRFVRWQPPGDEQRAIRGAYSLLTARDGTLWVGMFDGLASWRDGHLTRFPELDEFFVTSMLEDREGTVWVGAIHRDGGRLCALRGGRTTCAGNDGRFGGFVWSFLEDDTGTLWVGADSGLWRWAPGEPKRFPVQGVRIGDLSRDADGRLLVGIREMGLKQLIGERVEPYPIRRAGRPAALLSDREVDSNKLLRDRDGGLWVGTGARGLVHVNRGRADSFTKADGLSGDIICSLFEDREGNIWVATNGGLDRFRELPVRRFTTKQGLTTDAITSLVAASDGGLWLATRDGLMRWGTDRRRCFAGRAACRATRRGRSTRTRAGASGCSPAADWPIPTATGSCRCPACRAGRCSPSPETKRATSGCQGTGD